MRNPYDLIAEEFARERAALGREKKYLDLLLKNLAPEAHVLDLGCGTGRPIAEYLIQRGCQVTGADRSGRMLELARAQVPFARLIHGEMETLELCETFHAAVVWDSLFHVDRTHHRAIYAKIARWIVPGGRLMLSTGGTADAGFTSEMFGHSFFYSSYEPDEVQRFLQEAGFDVIVCEIDDPSSRGHVAIVAERRTRA